jgi:glycosyltransferase involved in cell wall biosynthesis
MLPIYINGKFLAQPLTGVQRVARALLQALDRLPPSTECQWTLLHPEGVDLPTLQTVRTKAVGRHGLPFHLWEQTSLPWAARDGLLLNLAGSAPAAARRQLCLIHDAAVFDCPGTYNLAFAAWYKVLFSILAWRRIPFLTVSAFSRGRLMHHLRLALEDVQVLGNGSDHLDHIVADDGVLGRLDLLGRPFVLAVGSDSPGKNLARLIQAVAALPPTVPGMLVMVGGCNPAVFRHTTALVVPSLYEGFGLPAAEAMRLGCPVVASTAGALPEVCGNAALAVDPYALPELAEALIRVLTDPPLRQRLSLAGRERTAGLTWQAAAAKFQSIVRQAAWT